MKYKCTICEKTINEEEAIKTNEKEIICTECNSRSAHRLKKLTLTTFDDISTVYVEPRVSHKAFLKKLNAVENRVNDIIDLLIDKSLERKLKK